MTTHALHIVEADDGAHLHLEDLPNHLRTLFTQVLTKAAGHEHSEFPDPTWPQITELVEDTDRLWDDWSDFLASEVAAALEADDVAEAVAFAFRRHSAGMVGAFAGVTFDPDATLSVVRHSQRLTKARRRTDLPPDHATTALVPQAVALGLGADPTTPRREGTRSVPSPPLSEVEVRAMEWAKARAGAYIRKPVDRLQADVAAHLAMRGVSLDRRELSDEELARVRAAVANVIGTRGGVRALEKELKSLAVGTAMLNDVRRIARTELQTAVGNGAAAAIRARYAGGGREPRVRRIPSVNACKGCKEVYGLPPHSKSFPLSMLEANEAAGGNFGRPQSEWVPVLGATHPQCACSPVVLDTDSVIATPNSARARLMEEARKNAARELARRGGR